MARMRNKSPITISVNHVCTNLSLPDYYVSDTLERKKIKSNESREAVVKFRMALIVASIFVLTGLSSYLFVGGDSRIEESTDSIIIGNARTLEVAYERWAALYTLNGGPPRRDRGDRPQEGYMTLSDGS